MTYHFWFRRILLLAVLALSGSAGAQWTRVASFSEVVNCGFFFNEQRGLVGLDYSFGGSGGGIFRTNDGGLTWQSCLIPSGYYGTLNDIFMKDSLNGWAIAEEYSEDSIFFERNLWRTTDGGVSWQEAPAIVEEGTSVYETEGGLVLYTKRYDPLNLGFWRSFNIGNSFSIITTGSYNDIDFSDALHGVVSPFIGQAMWTADGGNSWYPSSYSIESWGVYAQKGTLNFVMGGENRQNNGTAWTQIFRSENFGQTWQLIDSLFIRTTGHIAGVGNVIYVQADNFFTPNLRLDPAGMYRSTDGGYSWKFVGGPNHYRDSRFCVTGCLGGVVYAFDGRGGVWKTTNGGDGFITEPPKSPLLSQAAINLKIDKCSMLSDSITLGNLTCEPVTIEAIGFSDSSIEIVQSGALSFERTPALPLRLDPTKGDYIKIKWNPQLSGMPNPGGITYIHIRSSAYNGALMLDTLILVSVTGLGNAPVALLQSDSVELRAVSVCERRDTLISVGNPGCDTLTIMDAFVAGLPVWGLLDASGSQLTFPITIAPSELKQFRVRFTPPSVGSFASVLTVKLRKDGFTVDTLIDLRCRSFRGSTLAAAADLYLGDVPVCQVIDTTIVLTNEAVCEMLRIDSIVLNPAGTYAITPEFPLPYDLAPGQIFTVELRYVPQKNVTAAAMMTTYYTATGDSFAVDVSLLASGVPDLSRFTVSRADVANYAFTNKTTCSPGDSIEFWITNPGCDTLTVLSEQFTPSSPAIRYRIDEPLPFVLGKAGDNVHVTIAADPDYLGDHTASLMVRYRLSDSREFDTTFNFTSSVTAGPRLATVSRNAIDFGANPLCDSRDTSIEIVNIGCESVTVKDVNLQGSAQYVFTKKRPTPYVLYQFERDTISVAFQPLTPGQYNATLQIELNTDSDSSHQIAIGIETKDKTYLTLELPNRSQGLFAGDTAVFEIVPNADWSDTTLKDISFDIFYDDDLLTYVHEDIQPEGLEIDTMEVTNGARRLHVKITNASGIKFRAGKPYLEIWFTTALTDTISTQVKLTNLQLNEDNPYFKQCILAADTRDTTFTMLLRCGEPIIQRFISNRPILLIEPHRPNPLTEASGFILNIPFRLERSASITTTIYDEHGRAVLDKTMPMVDAGKHTLDIDCSGLPSGSYEYRISANGVPAPAESKFLLIK